MGVRVLEDPEDGACLYDSVTETAFGPIFDDGADAEDFLSWLDHDSDESRLDPRDFSSERLQKLYAHWCTLREKWRDDFDHERHPWQQQPASPPPSPTSAPSPTHFSF